MKDKSAKPRQRLALYLSEGSLKQIDDLSAAHNVASKSAIIAMAITRWHHECELVKSLLADRKENA